MSPTQIGLLLPYFTGWPVVVLLDANAVELFKLWTRWRTRNRATGSEPGQRHDPGLAGHGLKAALTGDSCRGTATSASWNVMYFECRVTFAPIFTNFSRSVVNDHCRILLGSAIPCTIPTSLGSPSPYCASVAADVRSAAGHLQVAAVGASGFGQRGT